MLSRAVFLDRDGVINAYVHHPEFGTVDSPSNPAEFRLLPRVGQAIAQLNRLGFQVVVVSNQPGIAKRKLTVTQLEAITRRMQGLVCASGGHIDGVYYCRHHPDALLPAYRKVCDCRKPKPGLLLAAARDFNIDSARSYMIGDGITDIMAGQAVGANTIFVSSRKCYICDELDRHNVYPDFIVSDLAEAANLICSLENCDRTATDRFVFKNCIARNI